MIWFGSSAGVALANRYPDAKSAGRWLLGGWHVTVVYMAGFYVMLGVLGWHPICRTGSAWICAQRSLGRSSAQHERHGLVLLGRLRKRPTGL